MINEDLQSLKNSGTRNNLMEETYQTPVFSTGVKTNKNKNKYSCFGDEDILIMQNPTDIFLDKVGYTNFHYNLIFIIAFMYFFIGSEFVITNIMLSTLEKEWILNGSQISILGSSIFVGVFITSMIAGPINNMYGRRNPSIIGCIIFAIFTILSCFAQSFNQMCFIKTMIGVGIGIIIPGTTSLLAECIPKDNRSLTLNTVWGLYPVGIIYICYTAVKYVQGNVLNWRAVCLINSFSSILTVFLSFYLKESPRYLILEQDYRRGFKILNLIGKSKGFKLSREEEESIKEYTLNQQQLTNSSSLSNYFQGDLMRISWILIFVWYTTSLIASGLLYVMPKHFDNLTKLDKSDSLKQMISSFYILFFCPYVRGYISELKFIGRKNTLAIGFLGAICFSVCCIFDEPNLSFLAGTLTFFINISLGLVSVYTAEIYNTNLRSGALGIGNAFTRIGGITAPFICEFAEKRIYKGSFYLFAFVGLINVCLCFGLKETRGKELDSTQANITTEK